MSLVGKAALAQLPQRSLLVCIRQQEHDHDGVHEVAKGLEEVAILVVRVTCAERNHRTRILSENSTRSVNASWLPPSVSLNEASISDLGDESAQWLTDFVVEGFSDFVEVNEGAPESRGEQLADCRLPGARGTDQDQRLGR